MTNMQGWGGLGAKPHKKDDRDWLAREIPPEKLEGRLYGVSEDAATSRRLWKMHAPDFRINQGQEGTCVGHGTVNQLAGSPLPHVDFPSFADVNVAHAMARQLYLDITDDSTYQQGAYPRDAMAWCVSKGYAESYYRLVSSDEVLDWLLHHGPVGFASPWYDSSWNVRGDGSYTKLPYLRVDPDSGLAGFHYYVLSGVDLAPEDARPPRVRMWNSWGPWWGLNGCAAIALDDLPILYDGDAYVMAEEVF
jgi:hypothetical protein